MSNGLTKENSLRSALEMLIREAQAVADDHHRPRYTRLDQALDSARGVLADDDVDEPVTYSIDEAIRLAGLWRAGKMIGGDGDGVRDALLAEVERLRGQSEPKREHPTTDPATAYRCQHEWKVKGLGGQAYCDICGVYRRDLL